MKLLVISSLTPAMVCMLNEQPHVVDGRDTYRLMLTQTSHKYEVKTHVRTQEVFAKRVQVLQPLLRKKGANGSYYSRRALSRICRVPYHMLKPHDEHKPISQSRMLRN